MINVYYSKPKHKFEGTLRGLMNQYYHKEDRQLAFVGDVGNHSDEVFIVGCDVVISLSSDHNATWSNPDVPITVKRFVDLEIDVKEQ